MTLWFICSNVIIKICLYQSISTKGLTLCCPVMVMVKVGFLKNCERFIYHYHLMYWVIGLMLIWWEVIDILDYIFLCTTAISWLTHWKVIMTLLCPKLNLGYPDWNTSETSIWCITRSVQMIWFFSLSSECMFLQVIKHQGKIEEKKCETTRKIIFFLLASVKE